jgi:two-component system sensor histidine kinase SenX3
VSDDEDDALLIDVTDTGVGMSPAKLAEVAAHDFKSGKRNSGVGLGLGVARHITASHAGEITVSSEEGKGSTFRIRIPRLAHTVVPATGGTPNEESKDEGSTQKSGDLDGHGRERHQLG